MDRSVDCAPVRSHVPPLAIVLQYLRAPGELPQSFDLIAQQFVGSLLGYVAQPPEHVVQLFECAVRLLFVSGSEFPQLSDSKSCLSPLASDEISTRQHRCLLPGSPVAPTVRLLLLSAESPQPSDSKSCLSRLADGEVSIIQRMDAPGFTCCDNRSIIAAWRVSCSVIWRLSCSTS